MPIDDAQLADREAGLESKLAGVEQQATESRAREVTALGAKEAGMKQPLESASAAAKDLSTAADKPLPESEAAKLNYQPKHLDANEMNKFSWGIIAMALVGGATAKGNWMGVSSSLKGAMEGILQGDADRSDREYEDFKRKFATAHAHDQDGLQRMRDTIENKNLSLNAKLQGVRLLADEYDMPVMRAAAETKSLDGLANQLNSQITAIERLREGHDKADKALQAARERAAAQSGPVNLDEKAKVVFNTINQITSGKSDILKPLLSRYGKATAGPLFQKLVDDALASNPNMTPEQLGADLAQNAVKYQGVTASYRQGLQRQTAVERLTLTVRGMEEKVIQAAKDVGLTDATTLNSSLNQVRKQFGDAAYQKLKTELTAVSRQYIEAVTMPGSNAQMHASAQETADELVNPNMPISAFIGAFEGMNEEIDITGGNLSKINDKLLTKLGADGAITFTKKDDTPAAGGATAKNGPPPKAFLDAGGTAAEWGHVEDPSIWQN